MKALAQKLETAVRGRWPSRSLSHRARPSDSGGRAALWFEPRDAQDLVARSSPLSRRRVTPTTLGSGANTLISDEGIAGPVIHLTPGFSGVEWLSADETYLGAGLTGIKALQAARSRGLTGPEFLVGIPGTLGGQVAMNAGTKSGEMAELRAVEITTPQGNGDAARRSSPHFSYRHCELPAGWW